VTGSCKADVKKLNRIVPLACSGFFVLLETDAEIIFLDCVWLNRCSEGYQRWRHGRGAEEICGGGSRSDIGPAGEHANQWQSGTTHGHAETDEED